MPPENNCIVVIPIYKKFECLEAGEQASIKRALEVFNKRSICFIGPEQLDFNPYLKYASGYAGRILYRKKADYFFADIDGYNRLLMHYDFYDCFSAYKYLLIY